MAIDILGEKIITLKQAAEKIPQRRRGKRPHISCIYRWTTHGLRGVILKSIQIGGTRCTSEEALARFFERLTYADSNPQARSLAKRRRDSDSADRKLRELGA